MPTVEKETVVTPVSSGGPGTVLAVVLGLVVVAVLGYLVYLFAFSGSAPGPTVIEHNTTVTPPPINMPAPSMPAPSSAPSTPSTPSAPSGGQ